MTRFTLTAAGLAAAAICGAASADISIQFSTGPLAGGAGIALLSIGSVTGTLTSFKADILYTNLASDSSWAADMLIAASVNSSVAASAGGYNLSYGTGNFFGNYTSGQNSASGAYSMLANNHAGLAFNGMLSLYIANGYSLSSGASYSGKITLKGLDFVPAPGAVALLGLAGLRSRRRR